jgi:ComF family protein
MMLGNEISSLPFFREVEMVVPVPLAPKKLKIRGYNQCEYIASGIAKAAGYNTAFNALIRNNYRGSQTKRNRIKRWENVKGSFEVAEPGSLYGKHILLVDDVITTGATLEACASEILKVEKTKISIATLAYTKDR